MITVFGKKLCRNCASKHFVSRIEPQNSVNNTQNIEERKDKASKNTTSNKKTKVSRSKAYSEWITDGVSDKVIEDNSHPPLPEWFENFAFFCVIKSGRTLSDGCLLENFCIEKKEYEAVFASWSVGFGHEGYGYNLGGAGSADVIPADCFIERDIYMLATYIIEKYSLLELKVEDITHSSDIITLFELLNTIE